LAPVGVLDLGFLRVPLSAGKALLTSVTWLILANTIVFMSALLTGRWAIYGRVWPIELLSVGGGLCLIMNVAASIWMTVPTGIVIGSGVILAYSALSTRWEDWAFLWVLELIVIALSILTPMWLAGHGDWTRRASRVLSWVFGLAACGWSMILLILSFFLTLFS
jgi:hypothetical protein